jgi:hypothetical protein
MRALSCPTRLKLLLNIGSLLNIAAIHFIFTRNSCSQSSIPGFPAIIVSLLLLLKPCKLRFPSATTSGPAFSHGLRPNRLSSCIQPTYAPQKSSTRGSGKARCPPGHHTLHQHPNTLTAPITPPPASMPNTTNSHLYSCMQMYMDSQYALIAADMRCSM